MHGISHTDQLVHDILSITESLVNDSSAAHLASVTSQKNDDAGAGSGAGAGQNGESTEGTARSLMRSTTSQDNYYAKLDKGSGVRAQGYAKQC